MYGDKDKCSYFINHLGPDAQHREFNSQSAKSEKWLNLPHSPLPVVIYRYYRKYAIRFFFFFFFGGGGGHPV